METALLVLIPVLILLPCFVAHYLTAEKPGTVCGSMKISLEQSFNPLKCNGVR